MAAVLLYHALGDSPTPAHDLFVGLDRLAWQFAALRAGGYRALTLDEFCVRLARPAQRAREVLLTFDDAYAHVLEAATPLLYDNGLTAVAFAPVAHLGEQNIWDLHHSDWPRLEVASPEALREAVGGPWEVACHGLEHVDLTRLAAAERRRQLTAARERLSAIIGHEVRDLAYPYGRHDEQVRADARAAGYRTGFTSGRGAQHDPFRVGRRPIREQDGERAFVVKASGAFPDVFGS
jgi:peptidoglycan/xylan/chitin deacetylase (PgdA/CDA1 family)